MVSAVVVVRDELADALLELSWQIVVFSRPLVKLRAALIVAWSAFLAGRVRLALRPILHERIAERRIVH